jgi:acyl-coenzyme A thioesterase PaaI-like protein
VHAGRRTATAEGRLYLEDDETVLFAHASTGCVILR